MSHTVFGRHTDQQNRTTRFQQWLNCDHVQPDGLRVPPPQFDMQATLELIVGSLQDMDVVTVDVGGDSLAEATIREKLTAEQNARVRFSEPGVLVWPTTNSRP